MDIEGLRKLVREMKKDQTLILAPDVYDSLATEMGHGPEVMGVAGSHSIRVQRSVALKPGTAMVMAEAMNAATRARHQIANVTPGTSERKIANKTKQATKIGRAHV